MNGLSGRSVGSIFALALGTWVLFMGLHAVAEAASTVSLEKPVHFTAPDGSDVLVEAGTYEVDTLVGSRLRLNVEGEETLFLDAQATTHSEELEAPLAVTARGENPDVVHIVLLLPNGQALDAPGSISGTRSRGLLSGLVSKTQIQVAVAQQAPVVRDHRGQPKVLPPPRPPVTPAPGTIAPIVRDHRTPPPSNVADFELAYHHAPIHYQDTNSNKYRGDYITRVDYDGDWETTNNWDNLTKFSLMAYVYYSVVESCSHWYIVYGFFHPQDWAGRGGQEHENDMEGVLSIVRKDGSRFGKLEGMVTTFHLDFYSYTPANSPLRDGPLINTGNKDPNGQPIYTRQDIDGRLTMQTYDGSLHALTNQEDKGHGVKAFPHAGNFLTGNGNDGIIYYPSRTISEIPQSGNDRDVKYKLLDIFSANGLWDRQLADIRTTRDHRAMGPTFYSWGTLRGNKSGGCGDGITITCKENSPHTPWGWDDTGFSIFSSGDFAVFSGELALDPAHLTNVYFTGLGNFSQQYIRNRYLSDLRNRGYRQGNLPKGWPSQLNIEQLYGKLTPTCG